MSHHLRTIAAICSLLAAGFSFAATPAQAASATIYVVSGVYDSGGGSNAGVATSFFCTNMAAVVNELTIVVHDQLGGIDARFVTTLRGKQTWALSTHTIALYSSIDLETGSTQGYAVISATNPNLVCSAMIVDASSSAPNGIALHMQRRTPLAKTLE